MSNVNEQLDEACEMQPAEDSWTERLTAAVSDYEAMGAEDAAGLGL